MRELLEGALEGAAGRGVSCRGRVGRRRVTRVVESGVGGSESGEKADVLALLRVDLVGLGAAGKRKVSFDSTEGRAKDVHNVDVLSSAIRLHEVVGLVDVARVKAW